MKTNQLVSQVLEVLQSYALASEREPLLRKILRKAVDDILEPQDIAVGREFASKVVNRLAAKLNINITDMSADEAKAQIAASLYPSILSPLTNKIDGGADDPSLLYPTMNRGK